MKNLFNIILCTALISVPKLVLADNSAIPTNKTNSAEPAGSTVGFPNPIKTDSIAGLFTALLDILVVFATPIVVFFIIYAGFLYVTARGNVETISKAHRALLYAVIGGVIILGGSVLIEVIEGTVNEVKR